MALPYTVNDPTAALRDPNDPYAAWAYRPPASEAQFGDQGFAANHAGAAGAMSGAASGAALGTKILPGWGTAIGAGAGAIYGAIKGHQNATQPEREDFAKSLGVPDTTALWGMLAQRLPAAQASELQDRALHKIGKHDEAGNAQWMQDVQAALNASGAQQPAQPSAPEASAAPALDPRRSAVLSALRGGGNYRDALVAYLNGGQ